MISHEGTTLLLALALVLLANPTMLVVGANQHNDGNRHGCIVEEDSDGKEPSALFCMFSLAPLDGPGSPSSPHGNGTFLSRDASAMECVARGYDGLVDIKNKERNNLARRIVDALGVPHWLGGDDMPNGVVTWSDGTEHSEQRFDTPWHIQSNQPNDCDGPGSETCVFMGPEGAWFDFACAPKTPQKEPRITAGPEIHWIMHAGRQRQKIEYSIWPLCGGNVLEGGGSGSHMSQRARRLIDRSAL